MCALNVDLAREEEILFESERAVLTNLRLLANLERKRVNQITDDVLLSDIANFKKSNVGQESRIKPGLVAMATGAFFLLLSSIANALSIGSFIEAATFAAGALAVVVGLYFVANTFLGIKPNTTLQFSVVGSRDIVVYFPGKDNPLADEMTRLFIRAKRGI